jgi:hypothetical protein
MSMYTEHMETVKLDKMENSTLQILWNVLVKKNNEW